MGTLEGASQGKIGVVRTSLSDAIVVMRGTCQRYGGTHLSSRPAIALEEGAEPYPMKRVAEVDEVSGNILVST